jgi:hypothetical protein
MGGDNTLTWYLLTPAGSPSHSGEVLISSG